MMQLIMERMSTDEKQRLMDGMMEKFFADLTPEEKQQMMASMMPMMMEMMPQMMEGKDPGNMMEMMLELMRKDMPAMQQMMTKMMPQCLSMMLPRIGKEERVEFIPRMVAVLLEQGSDGMTEEERTDLMKRVAKIAGA
ncbi:MULTISPECIES: hypothetical protein [Methanothrix]|nr:MULTISPECIES: hypothetical protein [Methanothrix]MBP7066763.1 hypothetical protein [Methanothrix sp.]